MTHARLISKALFDHFASAICGLTVYEKDFERPVRIVLLEKVVQKLRDVGRFVVNGDENRNRQGEE